LCEVKFAFKDVYVSEDKTNLYFGNSQVELRLSKTNGCLVMLLDRANKVALISNDGEEATESILVGGRSQHRPRQPYYVVVDTSTVSPMEYLGHSVEVVRDKGECRVELTICSKAGDWLFHSTYAIRPHETLIKRSLRVIYAGSTPQLLRGVQLVLPEIRVDDPKECCFEAPGLQIKSHYPLSHLPRRARLAQIFDPLMKTDIIYAGATPTWFLGIMAIHNPKSGFGLMWWAYSSVEPFLTYLNIDAAKNVTVLHHLMIADRFEKGHVISCGFQFISVFREGWREALKYFREWWESISLRVPQDIPEWVMKAAIYEVHIGIKHYAGPYSPFPAINDLIDALPRIKELGFNVIQIMPYCSHYTVIDYFDVKRQFGGDEESFGRLVKEAHQLGMRVILDWIIHGSNIEFSKLHKEHPEWYMKTEDGKMAYTYTWSFNLSCKDLQDYIINGMKFYVREFDVDGFRIDAPQWNFFPNWDQKISYRASYSTFAGVQALLERARAELKKIKPDVALYIENPGPSLVRSADFLYNYDEQWLFSALVPVKTERFAGMGSADGKSITAREAAEWLEQRDLAFPKGFLKAHHLDSHDTFEWGALGQFRRETFGLQPSRALFAFCAFLGGPVMNYVGGEVGSEEFYRRVLEVRGSVPELTLGSWNYTAIKASDEMIFTILRSYRGNHSIVVINFNSRPTEADLFIPLKDLCIDPNATYEVYDIFNERYLESLNSKIAFKGSELSILSLEMKPYSVRVLQIREQM